jgi:hypothetical protein
LVSSEVVDWAVYQMSRLPNDDSFRVIYATAVPEMLGRVLSGLTNAHALNTDADDAGSKISESDLRVIRPRFVAVFDAYRTKFGKVDPDAYYDVVELYLASVLATISHNVTKAS